MRIGWVSSRCTGTNCHAHRTLPRRHNNGQSWTIIFLASACCQAWLIDPCLAKISVPSCEWHPRARTLPPRLLQKSPNTHLGWSLTFRTPTSRPQEQEEKGGIMGGLKTTAKCWAPRFTGLQWLNFSVTLLRPPLSPERTTWNGTCDFPWPLEQKN